MKELFQSASSNYKAIREVNRQNKKETLPVVYRYTCHISSGYPVGQELAVTTNLSHLGDILQQFCLIVLLFNINWMALCI